MFDKFAEKRKGRSLAAPVTVAQWQKNERGEAIVLVLKAFDRGNITDLRTFVPDRNGKLEPTRGFNCTVDHLPKLARAFAEAERMARALGLLDDEVK